MTNNNQLEENQNADCTTVLPREPFKNIALTFSGGGFRAASFSLGALSYLYRCQYEKFNARLIDNVKFITSTSGGSLTNGKFAADLYSDPEFSFGKFYAEMREGLNGEKLLCRVFELIKDDDQWQVKGFETDESGNSVKVYKSRNLINAFAKGYDELLFSKRTLDCIYSPVYKASLEKVCFNATEFNNGLNFYFQSNGHTKAIDERGNGYLKISDPEVFRHLKISDIVAASSCFPSGFEPIIYPTDFIHENLTDVNKMLKAISYDHNNPLKLAEVADKPFALMDGGIADNMGIHSVMVEDSVRLRSGDDPFDLILACDVTSYFTDPLKNVQPKSKGWTTKVSINTLLLPVRISPVIFLLCILSVIFKVWPVAGYLLLIPSLAATALLLFVNSRLNRTKNSSSGSIAKTVLKNTRYFAALPLSSIIHMVQARVNSSLQLVSDLFLKQIRRGQYDNLFTKPRLVHRTISCLIYEFSSAHQKRRVQILNFKDRAWWKAMETVLMPGERLQKVADEAKSVGTTLWFDESDVKTEKRDKVIAVGQFTMCYNLIKHICRLEVQDKKYTEDTALQKLKQSLLDDWELFQKAPLFMISDLNRKEIKPY